jgi:cyclophilin family peptidyl-prolyl cis-trans isomerase
METSMGKITFQLFENEAPQSVKSFVELAQGRKLWLDEKTGKKVRRPLYSGVTFHRVIPNFMIQTGDPTASGAGDVGFSVPDEFHPDLQFDQPGRFGMANVGRPNTNSSQFFITEKPTPWLDGKHTVFGQVLEGMDVVQAIGGVARDEEDKPKTPVKIVRITFERVGPRPATAPEVPAAPAPAVRKKSATPAKRPAVRAAKPAATSTKKAATPPVTKAAPKAATPVKKK